jgi:hypothetical protein
MRLDEIGEVEHPGNADRREDDKHDKETDECRHFSVTSYQ